MSNKNGMDFGERARSRFSGNIYWNDKFDTGI